LGYRSQLTTKELTKHALSLIGIDCLAENPAPGTVMGHLRLPELKQAGQFLAPEFGPVRNSSTTGLPGQFGQHSNQQDLSHLLAPVWEPTS
jgi:hypothetical protein